MNDDVPLDEVTVADHFPARAADQPEPPRPTIVLLTGVDAGRTVRLRRGVNVIGRSPSADITLDEESVSRHHCEIVVGLPGGPTIRDLCSTNHTHVDGEDIGTGARLLEDGAKIRLSKSVVLKFSWQNPLEEAVHRNLYQAAVRDGLTGVFNKRYLLERFEQEHAWAVRNGRPLAVVVLDLDHFKRINDTYGHDAGDAVLRAVAGRVQEGIRREDVFARFGGEEFVLLMRETPLDVATEVAERLRRAIRGASIRFGEHDMPVTASIGLACTSEPGVETPMDLFARADRRLYEAKRTGRDRLVGPQAA